MKIIIDLEELKDLLDKLEGAEEDYARINDESKMIDVYEQLGNEWISLRSIKYEFYKNPFESLRIEINGNV